ncbi:MAG TPA: hypothetical protein VK806_08370 [Bacteroidia bacterium]|jgi:hypothetical protein|nr:hypothetical protein [Bacteroidia bacterium]
MKKLSVILASLVLFAGVSFASPAVKQDKKVDKKEKKADKKEKKADKKEKKADKAADKK